MELRCTPRLALLQLKIWKFSFIFCLTFIAYGTTEILQSSLYAASGYECLFAVYSCFLVSSLLAPLLVARIGPLATLWRCGFFYMLNVLVSALGPPPWLRTLMCACVGLAGGGFWNAQACYVSLLAQEVAAEQGVGVSAALSSLTSRFFVVFSSAQVLSQLLASAVLLGFGPAQQAQAVSALFGLLAALAGLGTLALARLEAPSSPSGHALRPCCRTGRPAPAAAAAAEADLAAVAETAALAAAEAGPASASPSKAGVAVSTTQDPTPLQVFYFLTQQPPLLAALPMLFYGGGSLGFVLGPFLGTFSGDRVGVSVVGFVAACYNVSNLVFALPMDYLVRQPSWGRRWVFVAGTALHLAWFAAASALLWAGSSGSYQSPASYALVFGAIALNGAAAPLFQSQLPALLQAWYTASAQDASAAIAVYRVMFSLGFCAAQGLSIGYLAATGRPCLEQQCAVWAAVLACAAASLAWLHLSKRRLVE